MSLPQAGSHETRILKFLANDSTVNIEPEESQHVLSLLDNFQIQGSNGTHQVFVTEVVDSLSELKCYPAYNKVGSLKLTWRIYPVPKIILSSAPRCLISP
jgi:hypothetical protein